MFHLSFLEWVGYAASVLVLVSMLMSSILRLRIVNLVGSALFSAYGFLIGALPVGLLNLFVVFANIYHLYKMFGAEESFTTLEIRRDNRYLLKFLDFYKKDIQKYFPKFEYNNSINSYTYMFLRNMAVAGVFLARDYGNKRLYIGLDYVIPQYRDFKLGKFIYKDKIRFFKEQGYTMLCTIPQSAHHARYLEKMGFHKETLEGNEYFVFPL
ncbi:MAG: hypothetical protein M0P66_10080 [Salinivirgaceae bacterium]|jgi:hypothetical protein|nr:hypothetical protein [Salinivirgaceae bacterium]